MTLSRIVIIACIAIGAGAALAQDGTEVAMSRTPASAQKFIAANPPTVAARDRLMLYAAGGAVNSQDACITHFAGPAAERVGNVWGAERPIKNAYKGTIGAWMGGYDAVVTAIEPYSEALRVGLRVGDRIVSVDGRPVISPDTMTLALSEIYDRLMTGKSAAPRAHLQYQRGGALREIDVDVSSVNGGNVEIPRAEMTPPGEFDIDWSKVQQVESMDQIDGHWLVVRHPADPRGPISSLLYAVQATRDRTLAAAQFLKDACDRAQGTGF